MPMLDFFKLGLVIEAIIRAMLATAGKGTARRQIQRTGNLARQSLNLFAGTKINLEYCAHKRLGIGMLAAISNAPMLQPFHYIAQIHHRYLMAH